MADFYFVGHVSADWSDKDNWSLSSGGGAAANIPTTNDVVHFDGNSHNCSANGTCVCGGLDFISYTNILTLAADIDCNGDLIVTSGAAVANGAFNINVAGNLTLTAATLSGTAGIVLDGTGTWSSVGATLTITNPITINSPLGTITLGQYIVLGDGGSLTYTQGAMVVQETNILYIRGSATLDLGAMTVRNIYNLAGTITHTGITVLSRWTFGGNTIFSGAYDINIGGDFDAGAPSTVTLSGDIYVAGEWESSGYATIFNGAFNIYVSGDFTQTRNISGTFNGFIMNSSGVSSVLTFSTSSYSIAVPFEIAGNVTFASADTMYFKTGTLKYISGTVTFAGDHTLTLQGDCTIDSYGVEWKNITISAGKTTLASALQNGGNFTLDNTAGVELDCDGFDVTVAGDFSVGALASLDTGTNTFTFNGESTISGSTTFYNLTFSPGALIHLTSGTTQIITNTLLLTGTATSGITIDATTPGSQATLSKSSGSVFGEYLTISDNLATGGAEWYTGTNSTASNTTGWIVGSWDEVTFNPPMQNFGQYAWVSLGRGGSPNTEIHYTADGTDPTYLSLIYTEPFKITGTVIKARSYGVGGTPVGAVYSFTYTGEPNHPPSGFKYNEYYLYSDKVVEMAPSGVSYYSLAYGVLGNAPVVVTSSGYEQGLSDPWAKCDGGGKYEKVGYGYFTTLDSGAFDESKNEFCLHPDASGKVLFNKILNEHVFIEYEGGTSSYYIMDGVDYNPMRNETTGGFVHFSRPGAPVDLHLTASQGTILADGHRGCTLTATLYDSNFDRVVSQDIVFELQGLLPGLTPVSGVYSGDWSELGYMSPNNGSVLTNDASGCSIRVLETTNTRGEAHVHYLTHEMKTGITQVKAYYSDASGIYDTVRFCQYWLSTGPFILDISLLDTLEYLTNDIYTYVPDF